MLRVFGRMALVLFGLALSLTVIELTLQAGGVYTRLTGRPQPTEWLTGRRRVMCVGDSNVYGLWVKREETFPSALERIWNAATPAAPVEVLNFGMPGLNSSKLRRSFRGLLDTFRPDIVLVLVGSNDINSVPVPIDEQSDDDDRTEYRLWRYSRLFRLVYMIITRLTDRGTEVEMNYRLPQRRGVVRSRGREFDLAGTDRMDTRLLAGWNEKLRDNLHAMARDSEAIGATFVALTYASQKSLYHKANYVIRRMQGKISVIDPSLQFASVCPDGNCPGLFFRDQHPSPGGYELFAAIVWRDLRGLGVRDAQGDETDAFSVLRPLVRSKLRRLRGLEDGFDSPKTQVQLGDM